MVAQLPGWGLVGTDRTRPDPYSGVTELVAGSRIDIPAKPVLPRGARTGILTGAIRFEGGPAGGSRAPVAGVVSLFDDGGRLLARFVVRSGHHFKLRVASGRYLLLADSEGWIFCGPARVRVPTARTAQVTVPTGCGVP